jgi:hypothetical protein
MEEALEEVEVVSELPEKAPRKRRGRRSTLKE